MAIKKSELYRSLWASCDELRGGMDASQYKDYVLFMLFVKYVSDKHAGDPYSAVVVPKGATFANMVALKGKPDIGDQINKTIVAPLGQANNLSNLPDFDDPDKLGTGQEKRDKLTKLIAIFENKSLDFSKNRADGDDLLGDAYEFLMRHFATESGKSKGQFYTPAEVSRVMAKVIGIDSINAASTTTVYDPTCGSGSLLLKVADEALPIKVSLYGQEKDVSTTALARMNMILHGHATAEIKGGASTLADPKWTKDTALQAFDFVVANPPFSDKAWTTGFDPEHDQFHRFAYGIPPKKQGDYAYLLHIITSLKSTGKGACILPHGVLFRGNAEAAIRKNLIDRGYIKGIIGLPANLFYGTGIPACIVVLDKEGAKDRKGIFMVDASKGFLKDGAKNRLREQDIHRIVDAFTRQADVPKYSRFVSNEEITEKNDFNLNIPRYIDSSEPEDLQDLEGHMRGGIPEVDVEALADYWKVAPNLRDTFFESMRKGYVELKIDQSEIRQTILSHLEFKAFVADVQSHFDHWRIEAREELRALKTGFHPKIEISKLSESLLDHFTGMDLIDSYAVYQHLMDFWATTMQDDAYIVAADGWKAEVTPTYNKKGKVNGWECDLIPKPYIVARYFQKEQSEIDRKQAELEALTAEMDELEEENSGEEGAFYEVGKLSIKAVNSHLKLMKAEDRLVPEEVEVLVRYLGLAAQEQTLKRWLKNEIADLDDKARAKYAKLTEDEVKTLAVDDKWLATISQTVQGEVNRLSQALTLRIRQLADRYATPLPELELSLRDLSVRVENHIERMGVVWQH